MLQSTILVFLILFSGSAIAAPATKASKSAQETSKEGAPKETPKADLPIEPSEPSPTAIPDDRFQLELGIGAPQYLLSFEGTGSELRYQPNLNTLTELSVTWKGITVGWGFRNPVSADDSINKGSSSFDDYWFGYSFDAVRVDVFYANFKGFYLDEGDDNTSPKKFLAPGLTAQTFGADVSWVLNSDEFSLRTAINMTERPKASGGSWIVGASFVDTSFNDDVDFFPATTLSRMGSDATLRNAHFQSLSIKGGYGQTWKFGEKWMLSIAAQGGWGGQKSTVGLVSDSYSQTQVNFKYDAWISGGWHGDDWFSGAKIMVDGTQFKTRELTVVSQLMEAKFFVGHAF